MHRCIGLEHVVLSTFLFQLIAKFVFYCEILIFLQILFSLIHLWLVTMSKNNKGRGRGRSVVSDDFGPPLGAPRRRNPAQGPQPAASTAPAGAWATQPVTSAVNQPTRNPAVAPQPVASAWGQPGQSVAASPRQPPTPAESKPGKSANKQQANRQHTTAAASANPQVAAAPASSPAAASKQRPAGAASSSGNSPQKLQHVRKRVEIFFDNKCFCFVSSL